MIMTSLEIVLALYRGLLSLREGNVIPVRLRRSRSVGTVQDDPFDSWIEDRLRSALSRSFEIVHSGPLTTPDLVIRDKSSGSILGLEVKKLVEQPNGKSPRSGTLDYNSCLPCGSAMVKVGTDTVVVPCYYLFALLSRDSSRILTSIVMDGDFLNFDFNLHKESKYANFTEYNHGPYGEGSVRHRKMYTYPNPLDSRIGAFHHRHLLVAKQSLFEPILANPEEACRVNVTERVARVDKFGNSFLYVLDDETASKNRQEASLATLSGIFDYCKVRTPKKRVIAIPVLRPL